ncbi:MAG: hypothetical protein AB8B93_12745 [Pseudomonadales bacterium]
MRTLIIQSHRSPLPLPWLQPCIDSVARWSRLYGFDYRWLGDELFASVSAVLRNKTRTHLPMTADLARLHTLQQALSEGYERVAWVDADVLVVAPERLELDARDHAFGREVWVQTDPRDSARNKSLRTYRKIHNAFMWFTPASTVLPFYTDTATRLLERHQGAQLAPQFIGPKLLTALHNLAQFNVHEGAAMLPPLVARDLVQQQPDAPVGAALSAFAQNSTLRPGALNLCSSLHQELASLAVNVPALIDQLLADDIPWPGISQD